MQPELSQHKVTVLLVDDQPLIGEAVRRMLAGEPDVIFHSARNRPAPSRPPPRSTRPSSSRTSSCPRSTAWTSSSMYREPAHTRDVPIVVLSTREEPVTKAEAFARGASDYIVKLPDRLELLARIRHHSRGYINQLQRDEAYNALVESQKQLADDVAEAAKYVQSLLPERWAQRADPGRLAVHPLGRPGRRHLRLPQARRPPRLSAT